MPKEKTEKTEEGADERRAAHASAKARGGRDLWRCDIPIPPGTTPSHEDTGLCNDEAAPLKTPLRPHALSHRVR